MKMPNFWPPLLGPFWSINLREGSFSCHNNILIHQRDKHSWGSISLALVSLYKLLFSTSISRNYFGSGFKCLVGGSKIGLCRTKSLTHFSLLKQSFKIEFSKNRWHLMGNTWEELLNMLNCYVISTAVRRWSKQWGRLHQSIRPEMLWAFENFYLKKTKNNQMDEFSKNLFMESIIGILLQVTTWLSFVLLINLF